MVQPFQSTTAGSAKYCGKIKPHAYQPIENIDHTKTEIIKDVNSMTKQDLAG